MVVFFIAETLNMSETFYDAFKVNLVQPDSYGPGSFPVRYNHCSLVVLVTLSHFNDLEVKKEKK